MTFNAFLTLAWQSVTDPRDVARLLLSTRLNTEALWTAFALVVVANTLVFGLSSVFFPDSAAPAPGALDTPMVFLAMQAATLGTAIVAVTWAGRMLGGTGRYADIALLFVWLQALRVVAQAAIMLILPLSSFLGALVVMAASAAGVWIAVHFVDEAHGLDNLFKSLVALVLGVLAMAIGLSILLSAAGVTPNEVSGYV